MAVPHSNDKQPFNVKTPASGEQPLAAHVRDSLEIYFAQLNGHDAAGLYALVLEEVEKPLLETTMKYANYNQTKAAKVLGLSRSTLRKKLDQYQIS